MDFFKIKSGLEKSRASALKKLEDLRNEITQVSDELYWLDHAPLPLDDALRAIDDFVKKHDDSSRAKTFFFDREIIDLGPFTAETKMDVESMIVQDGRIFGGRGVAHLADVLIPLLGPATVQSLLYDMAKREAPNVESGPPLAARPELKASLKKRKYSLEVEEEALICSAEELGMDGFYRRSDVNPEIVLMMES
jgi:hypothetical protein